MFKIDLADGEGINAANDFADQIPRKFCDNFTGSARSQT
jgi:hypothetical protein